jgi:hypothetical protein
LSKISQSLEYLSYAILLEGTHPLVYGSPADLFHVRPILDQFFDFWTGHKQLMYACSMLYALTLMLQT